MSDAIERLCQLVKDAGLTMTLHGKPVDAGELRRVATEAAEVRIVEALTRACGHNDSTVRNCPYQYDVNGDAEQRCKCCGGCAHECGMDI